MGPGQDETHAGHEARRGSNSYLVVGSGPEVPPLVSSTHLGSGLAPGSGNEPTLSLCETLQVGAPANGSHQVTQLSPTSAAGRGIRTGEDSCWARSASRQW